MSDTEQVFNEALGKNIEALRSRRGISRPQLSQQSGIEESNIWRIEKGGRSPSVFTLVQIARALGVGVSNLLPKTE